MAGITMEAQAKADQILVTGTGLALGYVVLSGIGISLGAFKVGLYVIRSALNSALLSDLPLYFLLCSVLYLHLCTPVPYGLQ
jgi:hypothetical protein